MRLRCAWQFFDKSPKNVAVINPCFRTQGLLSDADQLCEDLADALKTFTGVTTPLTVKAYDLEGTKPVYPAGEAVRDSAVTPIVPSYPPELAVCLSFFADQNRPRRRGRLYIPVWLLGASISLGTTVPSGARTTATGFVSRFASLGGVNVDWGVWSEMDRAFHKATDYFVSDAWAVQRRRGIQPTTRTAGTTSG